MASAISLVPACAMAQAYQRVAPKLPTRSAVPALASPASSAMPPAVNNANTQILSSLNGIVFVSNEKQLVPAGVGIPAGKVDVSSVTSLNQPGFLAEMQQFVGRPLTIGDLDKIRALTIEWQSQSGDPFIDVSIPPQNVTRGVIQVVVTKYWLGKVDVEGNRYFSQNVVKRLAGFNPGQPLTLASVQNHLDRANQNPFLDVDTVFHSGSLPGETDLTLKAKDKFPLRVYAGYDNNGVPSLGIGEVFVGANWANAFGLGQVLSYQYTRSISGNELSHSASYTVPLNWDNQLLIFGGYQKAHNKDMPSVFDSTGTSGQISVRFVHSFPRYGRLMQDVQLGYDFKSTNNNLDFFGYKILAQRAQIHQFSATYDGTLDDRLGQTTLENIFVFSPGGLTSENTTAVFSSLVPGATANYVYDRILLTRMTKLPANMSSISRVTLQLANHNLLDSEQLSGGGVGSVRGYYTDTELGSDGAILSQEFRAPPIDLKMGLRDLNGQLQFGAFIDYANLWQVQAIPDQDKDNVLLSTGVDAHLALGSHLDVQWDIGWRLKSVQEEPKRGAFGDISVVASF